MIGPNGSTHLAVGLKCCARLKVLNMYVNNIDMEGERDIATATRQLLNLKDINISWNNIGQIAFADQPNLIKLNISGTNIGPALIGGSPRFPPTLQKLNLSHNEIDSNGALALAESLKSCTEIRKLFLSGNKIGFAEALAIIENVKTSIKEVDLSNNMIGDEYLQLQLFALYPDLQLDLSHNSGSESQAQTEDQDVAYQFPIFADSISHSRKT